jgi:Motility quorum-sensing regulator, toxin of MqsA
MVTLDDEKRYGAACNLDVVKALAAQGCVIYYSPQVQKDIVVLGFEDEDVCARLCMLQPSNYAHSVRYAGLDLWFDVYLIAGLYVKFKLDRKCLNVVLHSFHPERDS